MYFLDDDSNPLKVIRFLKPMGEKNTHGNVNITKINFLTKIKIWNSGCSAQPAATGWPMHPIRDTSKVQTKHKPGKLALLKPKHLGQIHKVCHPQVVECSSKMASCD